MLKKHAIYPYLAALIALFAAAPAAADITKHYEKSHMAKGEKGVFFFELVPSKEGLMMGVNEVELIIHNAQDEDVPGAAVTVTPWMPEHNHGVSEKPVVTDRGGGAYSVGNLLFIMTGWWELTVEARKGELSDKAVFNFPEVGASGHGHDMPVTAKSDLDTSTSIASGKGLFQVSYAGGVDPLPLNRIHSWTLTVKDKGGQPVTGASIKLVGDMPEHGHGLPTLPEMTEELPGGKYVIEGIRFSMPGWWVMTFHIRSGNTMDNASFNVILR